MRSTWRVRPSVCMPEIPPTAISVRGPARNQAVEEARERQRPLRAPRAIARREAVQHPVARRHVDRAVDAGGRGAEGIRGEVGPAREAAALRIEHVDLARHVLLAREPADRDELAARGGERERAPLDRRADRLPAARRPARGRARRACGCHSPLLGSPSSVQPPPTYTVEPISAASCDERAFGRSGSFCHARPSRSKHAASATEWSDCLLARGVVDAVAAEAADAPAVGDRGEALKPHIELADLLPAARAVERHAPERASTAPRARSCAARRSSRRSRRGAWRRRPRRSS